VEAAELLRKEAAALDLVRDAFGHLKAIESDDGGKALLKMTGSSQDAGGMSIWTLKLLIPAAKTRQWEPCTIGTSFR